MELRILKGLRETRRPDKKKAADVLPLDVG
jgi:hypothetical protein